MNYTHNVSRFEAILSQRVGETVSLMLRSSKRFMFEFRGKLDISLDASSNKLMAKLWNPSNAQSQAFFIDEVDETSLVELSDGAKILRVFINI